MELKDLLVLTDRELLMFAGEATHQHFKGGLYQYLGVLRDADSGQPILGDDGEARVVYRHCYPYEKQLWVRDHSEFFGLKDGKPRFRDLRRL
jgi:hypothetical protein